MYAYVKIKYKHIYLPENKNNEPRTTIAKVTLNMAFARA
jgi:hypothetical protein